MINNARLLYATNPSSPDVAYGHALPCAPQCVISDGRIRRFEPFALVLHSISVPISRGSPPVLTE